jgi:hypothetical protein
MEKQMNFLPKVSRLYFANNFDTDSRAWVPEVWAQETLAILEENMVIGRLVHTDFSDEISTFGDVVNTRKPGEFEAERKGVNDDVTVQSATGTNVPVKLDQHIHTSFLIRDGEESTSFADLVAQYLNPAGTAMARTVDRILLGQVYQFLGNSAGQLGSVSDTVVKGYILDTREIMNRNNAWMSGRNLIVAPGTETEMLKLDTFITADKIGDDGTALREASIGRKLGFDIYMCQNVPDPTTAVNTVHDDELSADVAKGATTLPVDDGTQFAVGQYITLTSDLSPKRITAIATNDLTINRPTRAACPSATDDITEYLPNAVDLTGHSGVTAYPIGYDKRIKVDDPATTTAIPIQGQLVSFSSGATLRTGEYRIIRVIVDGSDYYILLDRPLEAALSDGDIVNYGPNGDYNFAFHRNALSLVSRPLAQPRAGTGALSGVANYNDMSIRVTITYEGRGQGHLVTLDVLAGVKVLDTNLGAVMLG